MAGGKGWRNFSKAFKAQVARDALRDVETVVVIAARHKVHPNQVREWRRRAEAGMVGLFGPAVDAVAKRDAAIKELRAKIGELTMERDFLPRLGEMNHAERRSLIEWDGAMSVAHQCRALGISRRSAYDAPRPAPQRDLDLMRRIDEVHTEHPTWGSRRMVGALDNDGVRVGRNRVVRLMRLMTIAAVARKPLTSVKAKGHKVFPYLLRGLDIVEPNHVWCSDITYIPMRGGFMHLVAVMDWATRFVPSRRLSNCMETRFCLDALDEALRGGVAPRILNSDQGSQFTSEAFTGAVLASGAAMSMDGRGRWRDNVVIERFWRSLKQEAVCLHELRNGVEAHRVIGDWIECCNRRCPHSALGYATPAMKYEGSAWPGRKAA